MDIKVGVESQHSAGTLTPGGEIDLLLTLEEAGKDYPAESVIFQTGCPISNFYILHEGWAYSARFLADGQRQILDIYLPGQIMAIQDLSIPRALFDLVALTDIHASAVPYHRVHDAFSHSAELSERLFQTLAREQALVNERLINIGRRSAIQRLAHFFLELHYRLGSKEQSFYLPPEMNQSVIGDALSMTSVHVSRTLKELKIQGLIHCHDNKVTLLQPGALIELAEFDNDYLRTFED